MKVCAVTMVYQDYWALAQWYRHYGRLVGFENLFIVAHGQDDRIAQLCPDASVITVPRDSLEGFDRKRSQMLNSFADGLGVTYDWVIRTDADELIFFDPDHYASLGDVFAEATSNAIFAVGLNVAEIVDDRVLQDGQMALGHRRTAVFSGHYSKAWAAKRGTALWRHGIWVPTAKLQTVPFDLPRGVYLAHLKYANLEALEAANRHRTEIGRTEGKGLPGPAWKEADKHASQFYEKLALYKDKPWGKTRDLVYAALADDPLRDDKENVLRSRSKVFKYRVELPDWVADHFGDSV